MPPLIFLLPILFLGGIVSTIAGGGLGILLTIAATFFMDVRASVVLVSLLAFVIQIVKIIHFRGNARWDIIGWYLVLGIPCSFAGGWMLFVLPERGVEIVVGLLCVAFCVVDLGFGTPKIRPSKANLLGLGAVNGFLGGMVGNGALLRAPALLAFGLTKEQFVGTSSVIALFMNIGKSSAYLTRFTWTGDIVLLLALSVPAVYAGVSIGKYILRLVRPAVFERFLTGIVFLGAIRLIFFP